ncbi:hypothetical protein LTR62_000254 [Meristemomyces frigidus]|uniref:Elongator complex protein 2 n=1 Tax=Meristemomyces frigidus TaxID=1508187 RepID=A0AAN7TR87_9PEZI|nr:hypothetical protein LTR62_000254 [Meristemomyces frigidus]
MTNRGILSLDFTAAGGNRHPSAADWTAGELAYGAGTNIAIWNTDDVQSRGVSALVRGHTDTVNTVKFHDSPHGRFLISGGADKTVRLWKAGEDSSRTPYEQVAVLTGHTASVNTISVLPGGQVFVTGAADGTVKAWHQGETGAKLEQSIDLKPRYLPLATAIAKLNGGAIVLAVAGTSSIIQLYVRSDTKAQFELQASLSGHEGWIRSLDFVRDGEDLLLASASQDKYIRLWRFRNDQLSEAANGDATAGPGLAATTKSLSNKAHKVGFDYSKYAVTFEALLIGHEDWIYTARWAPASGNKSSPTLLTASADNSLAIWHADQASGVWVCNTRLGEISAQKGSTTATGSTGGFWIGLWHPEGKSVASLGRIGSWRQWMYDSGIDTWVQGVGVSGHTQEVQGLAWARDGSYLLTTSSDQTTRMFAAWKRDGRSSWHEFARPQIHGYDLNCIGSLGVNRFVSGADEKLLRVFDKPKAIDSMLSRLSGTEATVDGSLADAANMPVLGLSNKAITAVADDEPINGLVNGNHDEREAIDPASIVRESTLDIDHPPFEDQLARHTLWPEHEKLYGHGYEISAVATSHDAGMVATACKASSIDHAVIRLYETKEWREVKPALTAHTLTVTALAFSCDDEYLLSVGRDRQWAIFQRTKDVPTQYVPLAANTKGHSRMILDCAWAPSCAPTVFATAGRDKAVKIWKLGGTEVESLTTIATNTAVTALAFSQPLDVGEKTLLAFGGDDGQVYLVDLLSNTFEVSEKRSVPTQYCASAAITCLRWRPGHSGEGQQLAVGSEDGAVRILTVHN